MRLNLYQQRKGGIMGKYGYCQCGCGNKTPLRKYNRCNLKKGDPTLFLPGHCQIKKKEKCSVENCDRIVKAKSLCNIHYMRKWKTGEVFADVPPKKGREDLTLERFDRWTVLGLHHIDKSGSSYWKCVCDCGTIRNVRHTALKSGGSKSCGCLVKDIRRESIREKSTNWKGGRRYLNGYVMVKNRDHPNADNNGYVAEHRMVMSDFMERPLERHELVHHKNGVKDDNRLENLKLLTYSNHHGEIKCPFCKERFLLK